jgi:hypothetical protein
MLIQRYITDLDKLKELAQSPDTECAHSEADAVLCKLLIELGEYDVVTAYRKIKKWYA